jgi:hypothetical protein
LPGPKTPNHSETEKRNDKNAAAKINISDRLSFICLIYPYAFYPYPC